MLIDIAFAIAMLIALIKGFREGLVVALFSVIAFVVGIAAALKLSSVVADHLRDSVNVSAKWLPFLSFALVFIVVVLLIRWAAKLIEAALHLTLLGWVNRLGGMIFYLLLYLIGFSVVLFFIVQLGLISEQTLDDSIVYEYVEPVGPFVIDKLGALVPWFRDMFTGLEEFFQQLSDKIPPPQTTP